MKKWIFLLVVLIFSIIAGSKERQEILMLMDFIFVIQFVLWVMIMVVTMVAGAEIRTIVVHDVNFTNPIIDFSLIKSREERSQFFYSSKKTFFSADCH